jgi:hypothetical protein
LQEEEEEEASPVQSRIIALLNISKDIYKSGPYTYKVIQTGVMKVSKRDFGLFSRYPNSSVHPNIVWFG